LSPVDELHVGGAIGLVLERTVEIALGLVLADPEAEIPGNDAIIVGDAGRAIRAIDVSAAIGQPAITAFELGEAFEGDVFVWGLALRHVAALRTDADPVGLGVVRASTARAESGQSQAQH